MTQQIGTWRVQYRPGDWIVLSGPTSLVVLQPASGEWSELVSILWEQVVASATINDLASRLGAYGVDTMPSFAALFWHVDGLRSLVRGGVFLIDVATGATLAQGEDVQTWSEVGLSGVQQVEVVLSPVGALDPQSMLLPLVVGAVRASSVVLDARPAVLLVSPQELDTTTPAAAAEPLVRPALAVAAQPGNVLEQNGMEPESSTGPQRDTGSDSDTETVESSSGPSAAVVESGAVGAPSAGVTVLPGVPPINLGDADALGTQGYLGTESDPGSYSGTATESEAGRSEGAELGPGDPDAGDPDASGVDARDLDADEGGLDEGRADEGGEASRGADQPDDRDQDSVDEPDTEPFDVVRSYTTGVEDESEADENENADTQLMFLPPVDDAPQVEVMAPAEDAASTASLSDDDENADTQLMLLPPANVGPTNGVPAEDRAVDEDPTVDDDENAKTELISLSVADPSQGADPSHEADQVDPADRTEQTGTETEGWPTDPQASGLELGEGTAGRSLIMAVTCPRLHPNPPPAGVCRVCGEAITPQGPRLVTRPVLATLRGSGGDVVLDRPVRIGRAPSPDGDADQHLMTVISPSQDISRTHLEIAPDGWQVIATDLHSTNGTLLVSADGGIAPHPLSPGEPVVLELGAALELGDGVTIVVDPPPER